MKDLSNKKFGRLLVLEKTNKRSSGSVIWKCLCDCGNFVEVSTRSLNSNNTKSCGCLNTEKRKQRIEAYNKTRINDLTNQVFGKLLVLNKTNLKSGTNTVWKCLCECGNITYVSSNNLNINNKNYIKSCGCLKKENAHFKDLSNQKFGKLKAIEKTDMRKNNCIIWRCQCDCGNIVNVPSSLLISNGTKSCGCLKSQGEEKILNILQINNIPFEKEKIFDFCVFENNYHPRFDFFINNSYIIEYDGVQHFKQTGWENLNIVQARDLFKNEWCKKNDIPIIRIPYTHLDNLCLEDLLLETSKFLI